LTGAGLAWGCRASRQDQAIGSSVTLPAARPRRGQTRGHEEALARTRPGRVRAQPDDRPVPRGRALEWAKRRHPVPLVGRREGKARRGWAGPHGEAARWGHYDLVLELSDRPLEGEPPDPGEAWAATEESWSAVVPDCGDLIAARDARHAYAVLRGPAGLYTEEYDVHQCQLRGNLPQAFVHARMLECAARLSAAPSGPRVRFPQ
jgi:hypothetical protein